MRPYIMAMACLVVWIQAKGEAGESLPFSRDVRPILSNKCYFCHGPDEKKQEGGLRLDQRDSALAKQASGRTAIVPGDVDASELVRRILSTDPAIQMPPPDSGRSLTSDEKAKLTRWVKEGADFSGHWAFSPVRRPQPPAVDVRTNNPIDQFVFARAQQEQLTPSPEADKITLIRRLTLDLTGLPPTPAEVDAFLADQSSKAYDNLVDRLLDSPRYGEHFGRIWLDAARYGDTHGLHLDNERSMWPYRDWVIRAFNENKPFDEFTVEQLAGDLIPNATIDQQIASGFNRCNVTTSEGGSINEEVLVRYAVDRTEAMGTVWMGMTLGCCVCHSHKFDPISQREFYQLYAFFNSLADNAMDGNIALPPPLLKLPTPAQRQESERLNSEIARARSAIAAKLKDLDYQDPAQGDHPVSAVAVVPREEVWFDDDVPPGANPQGNTPWQFVVRNEGPVFSGDRSSTRTADGFSQHYFTGAKEPLVLEEGDVLFAYCYLDPANPPAAVMLQFNDGSWEHRAVWGEDKLQFGKSGTPARRMVGPRPPAGQWIRLEIDAGSLNLGAGTSLNGWAFTQFGGTVFWDRAGVIRRSEDSLLVRSLKEWDKAQTGKPSKGIPEPVQSLLKTPSAQRNPQQQQQIRDYFLQFVCVDTRDSFKPLQKSLDSFVDQQKALDQQIAATLVSADLPTPRPAHVLMRGQYDKLGEQVARGVPAVFPPLPENAPSNRLGLAQWLVRPEHPLTARVVVNRFWQHFFGTGIVKTTEDFGSQGEWPVHPELLDWLATEFIQSHWNVKQLHRLIVTSATYRQSSHSTAQGLAKDPDNRLLARGPRFRLDAEVIRDSVLSISGLLVEQRGGKSAKPYQPEGIWEAVTFTSSNTHRYVVDQGNALYRRSLYTFWKRTSPPPSMTTFDAPSRENCTVRRPRTNTPLQALALMNDRQYVEAARNLAVLMILEGGSSDSARLTYAFRRATSRTPKPRELEILDKTLQHQRALFSGKEEQARKLISYGETKPPTEISASELAAFTMTANLILNLDELITKE